MRLSHKHTHKHKNTHRCGYAYQPNKNILYPEEDLEDDDDNEEGKEAGEAAPKASDSMSVDASEVCTSVKKLFACACMFVCVRALEAFKKKFVSVDATVCSVCDVSVCRCVCGVRGGE
jgi:hypothetical protein